MKHFCIIFFLILSVCFQANAEKWSETAKKINAEINKNQKDIKETETIIRQERLKITGELETVKNQAESAKKQLDDLKAQLDALLAQETAARQEIEAEESQINTLTELLKTIGKDVSDMAEKSFHEKPAQKPDFLQTGGFPSMADIESLAQIFFDEITADAQIFQHSGTFINEQGTETVGEILRVGKFTLFYKNKEGVGYLRLDRSSGKLVQIPGRPPWRIRRAIKKYFDGNSENLPLDLSGGVIVEQINKNAQWGEWLRVGGFLVWPILMVGLAAFLIGLERLWSLGRIPSQTDSIMNKIREFLSNGNMADCQKFCQQNAHIPTCNVLKSGLECADNSKEIMENALEEAILGQLPKLERFLSTLGVLAAVAPLLGLLGTVTGMIHTFQGITVFGTSDPRMMSGGISEALITTQLGLGVAIPIMIVHHFFDRRVEKIIGDMEEKGTALITTLLKQNQL